MFHRGVLRSSEEIHLVNLEGNPFDELITGREVIFGVGCPGRERPRGVGVLLTHVTGVL